jgi:hypothetical protein
MTAQAIGRLPVDTGRLPVGIGRGSIRPLPNTDRSTGLLTGRFISITSTSAFLQERHFPVDASGILQPARWPR